MIKLEKLPFCENFFFEICVIKRAYSSFPGLSHIPLDIASYLEQNVIELQERLLFQKGRRRGKSRGDWDETLRQKDCNLIKSWKDPILGVGHRRGKIPIF